MSNDRRNYEHYYTLAWDTYGKDGKKRHYSRHLTDRDEATRRAKALLGRAGTDRVKLREMESWDEGPVTHINFIGHVSINR